MTDQQGQMPLDDAFANAAYIPGGDEYPARWAAQAEAFRGQGLREVDVPHGAGPRQVFDLFHPSRLARGVVIFIHGGYWLRFDKSFWSHLAAGPLAHGWAVAMPSYDLCPQATIPQITAQIAVACQAIADRVPGPVRLVGHSAGGHLVARMVDVRIGQPFQARVQKIVPISPVADLAPLMQTSMARDLHLDPAIVQAESPVNQPAPQCPVTVWVGAEERPVFLAQADDLAHSWGAKHVVVPGRHHFDIIEALADPNSPLTQEVLGG